MSSHRNNNSSAEHYLQSFKDPPSRSQTLSSQGAVESIYSQSRYSESSESTSASSVEDSPRNLVPGIYVPTFSIFDSVTEDVDHEATGRHAVRLAEAGVKGIVTQGSNGEAVHLTSHERKSITKTTRKALTKAGYSSIPVIVGCGAQATRGSIELCREAFAAGGDYALILPPSYYKPSYRPDSLIEFFRDVADASPIPILIYNFPGGSGNTDMSSDDIAILSSHPNIVGCKLTCGNVGKLSRIATAVDVRTPAETNSGFMCMAGSADFILPSLVVGGSGAICGLANIAPKSCVKLVELYTAGKMKEAKKLQTAVALGDWSAIANGIVGTKSALETYYGYGGLARRPLPRPSKEEAKKYAQDFKDIVELEKSF